MTKKEVIIFDSETFLNRIEQEAHIDESTLSQMGTRFHSLLKALVFVRVDQLNPLSWVLQFGELISTYKEGFKVIYEHKYYNGKTTLPTIQLICMDSAIGMKRLLNTTNSVVLTSGTLSPMDIYARLLGLVTYRMVSVKPNWLRNSVQPMIVTKASDQSPLTSEFIQRANTLVSRNYGDLLLYLARYVPDGIVAFFPSYDFLAEMVGEWKKLGIIDSLLKHKLLFIEAKDQKLTSEALNNYRLACERGRGGVFLCVARGKVAEGVDFKDHLGRCALVIGIPFQHARSRALLCRMEFLEKTHGITQGKFLVYNALKQTAQCLGRVIRGKLDYGIMILADRRFTDEKLAALPEWIRAFIKEEKTDLQMDLAVTFAKKFFVEMAKEITVKKDIYFIEEDFN